MDNTSQGGGFAEGQKAGAGRFTLIRLLGKGGMGVVWLVKDEQLNEELALKFLPPDIQHDAEALSDMRRETQKSRKLTHPHIIRIHDFVHFQGEAPFISMEFVDGEPLSNLKLQQPQRFFTWDYIAPLVEQMCNALEYAHSEGVIHRDLKPGNMMVDKKGRLKLADFGIAAQVSETMGRVSVKHTSSGTPTYMSPQQMNGQMPKVTDDIYALGATIYELLTSKPPFYSGNVLNQVENVEATPLEQRLQEFGLSNSIPPAIGAMVMACLAKDPAQRPQTMTDVKAWVKNPARTPAAKSVEVDVPAKEGGGKAGMWIGVGVAALLVLGLGGWFMFGGKIRTSNTTQSSLTPAPSPAPTSAAKATETAAPAQASQWRDAIVEWESGATLPPHAKKEGAGIRVSDTKGCAISKRNDHTNLALKVTARGGPSTPHWYVAIRDRYPQLDRYQVSLDSKGDGLVTLVKNNNQMQLKKFKAPAGFSLDKSHTLEVRAEGDLITVLLNGSQLASVRDGTLQAGRFYVIGTPGILFEKAEYRELAGNTGATTSTENWKDGLAEWWAKSNSKGKEFIEQKAGGWRVLRRDSIQVDGPLTDVAMRATVSGKGTPWEFQLRGSSASAYQARVQIDERLQTGDVSLRHRTGGNFRNIANASLPSGFSIADGAELEFRAQGDTLTFLFNGVQIVQGRDSELKTGGMALFYGAVGALVQKVEYCELSSPVSLNATNKPSAAIAAKTTQLVPLVDVKRDAIKGAWSKTSDGLVLSLPAEFGVLELPYEPPAEYNLEAEFTPTDGTPNPNFYIHAGGASFAWKLNAHGRTPPMYGFDLFDGKKMPDRPEAVAQYPLAIENGKRYTTVVEVRRGGMRALVNGVEVLKWSGDFKHLSMEEGSKLKNPRAIGVGSWKRAIVFHRVTVREVSGTGKVTAPPTASLPKRNASP